MKYFTRQTVNGNYLILVRLDIGTNKYQIREIICGVYNCSFQVDDEVHYDVEDLKSFNSRDEAFEYCLTLATLNAL